MSTAEQPDHITKPPDHKARSEFWHGTREYGVQVPLAIVGGASVGAIAGVVNSLLVTQAEMAPFIVTRGMLSSSHERGGQRVMLAAALATWPVEPRIFTESPFAPVRRTDRLRVWTFPWCHELECTALCQTRKRTGRRGVFRPTRSLSGWRVNAALFACDR
jgi:hypothetical protein